MKVIPVTCRYAGSSKLVQKVTEAIKVHQNNEQAVAFGVASAWLLEAVLLGAPLHEALGTLEANLSDELKSFEFKQEVIKAFARGKKGGLEEAKDLEKILLEVSNECMSDKPDSPFYNLYARACALPGSFIGPVALFYKAVTHWDVNLANKGAYVNALRDNILAAGDTCSRAIFAGALLAAAGVKASDHEEAKWNSAIPESWTNQMHQQSMERVMDSSKCISDSFTTSVPE
jgi:ADP-ribosylglycohydrolase